MDPKLRTGLAAAGIVLALALLAGGTLYLFSGGTGPPAGPAAVSDPWPECAAVRTWLKNSTGEHRFVAVVAWTDRGPAPAPPPVPESHPHMERIEDTWARIARASVNPPPATYPPGCTSVGVRYRWRTLKGQEGVEDTHFYVKDGVVQ
ncbi:MAG: hypothetical protein V4597_11675 [Pseudomonadota bacterium]